MKRNITNTILKKIALVLSIFVAVSFLSPKPVNASVQTVGGKIMRPICEFWAGVGDGVMDIIHQIFVKQGQTLISVNVKVKIGRQIERLIVVVVTAVLIASFLFSALGTASALLSPIVKFISLIKVGSVAGITAGATALSTIVKAIAIGVPIAGGVFASIWIYSHDNWWNNEVVLPLYSVSPEEIFRNDEKFPLFSVDFFNIREDEGIEYEEEHTVKVEAEQEEIQEFIGEPEVTIDTTTKVEEWVENLRYTNVMDLIYERTVPEKEPKSNSFKELINFFENDGTFMYYKEYLKNSNYYNKEIHDLLYDNFDWYQSLVNATAEASTNIIKFNGVFTSKGILYYRIDDVMYKLEVKSSGMEFVYYLSFSYIEEEQQEEDYELENLEHETKKGGVDQRDGKYYITKTEKTIGKIHPISYYLANVVMSAYVVLQAIALVAMMSILVYIGIRILISSTNEQKAKYKEMLGSWLTGMILLFVMHYIMSFSNLFVGELSKFLNNMNRPVYAIQLEDKNGLIEEKLEEIVIQKKKLEI